MGLWEGLGLNAQGLCTGIAVLLLFIWLRQRWCQSRGSQTTRLPPGPPPLPVLGNLWPLSNNPESHLLLTEWGKQYGDIYTVWYGSKPVVVLNSSQVIHEAFVQHADECSYREPWNWIRKLFVGDRGGTNGLCHTFKVINSHHFF